MDAVLTGLTRLVETNVWIAPFASFLGGILTASNPCVLVMIPLAMAYVGGYGDVHALAYRIWALPSPLSSA